MDVVATVLGFLFCLVFPIYMGIVLTKDWLNTRAIFREQRKYQYEELYHDCLRRLENLKNYKA